MLVSTYESAQWNIAEDSHFYAHHHEILKCQNWYLHTGPYDITTQKTNISVSDKCSGATNYVSCGQKPSVSETISIIREMNIIRRVKVP